jgi:hypothetical protein
MKLIFYSSISFIVLHIFNYGSYIFESYCWGTLISFYSDGR